MAYISFDHFFTTLSNRQRVRILQFLDHEGPMSVSDIAAGLHLEQSAASHGLKRLLLCHFVMVKQEGKERIYEVNADTIQPLLRQIERHVEKYCVKNCEH